MHKLVLTVSAFFLSFSLHSAVQKIDDETKLVLESIQKRYQKLGNWKAKFTQDSYSVGLGKASNNDGAFYYVAPNKFRFSLLGPEHSDFVSTGKKAWYARYQNGPKKAADVLIYDDVSQLNLNRYLILFRGLQKSSGDVETLLKEFEIQGKYKEQQLTLSLVPRDSTEISELILYFNNDSEVLKKAEILDLVGNKTTLMINTHEAIKEVDPKVFEARYPKNSKVSKGNG